VKSKLVVLKYPLFVLFLEPIAHYFYANYDTAMKKYMFLGFLFALFISCKSETGNFVCKPCDLPCDALTFNAAGICPHCKMDLVRKSELVPEIPLVLNEITIKEGTGKFLVEGGTDKEKTIVVHYYKPKNLNLESNIIFVIPGAGRNGDEYRDTWIEKANKYNLLVLSPEYSETHYPEFWSYNLAGMITDIEINSEQTAIKSFKISQEPENWIFNDFDRIFYLSKQALNLNKNTYDLFGHSAGGQIAHRFAIFKSQHKANRILASNSGWYTIPIDTDEFPYGLKGTIAKAAAINFNSKLVLFIGEQDNAEETRGSIRHTPEADKQGFHRLARGKYFYKQSKKIAADLHSEFNWKLEVIPGIGHDYKAMSQAAADYLYEDH